jgi:hypothetical protein
MLRPKEYALRICHWCWNMSEYVIGIFQNISPPLKKNKRQSRKLILKRAA